MDVGVVVHLVVRDRVFHVQSNVLAEASPTLRIAYQHLDPTTNAVVETFPQFVSPEAVASLLHYIQKREYVPPTRSGRLSVNAETYPPKNEHVLTNVDTTYQPSLASSSTSTSIQNTGPVTEPRYEVTEPDVPDPIALVELFWLVSSYFASEKTAELRRRVASELHVHLHHGSWRGILDRARQGAEWVKTQGGGEAGLEQLEMVVKMAEAYAVRNGLMDSASRRTEGVQEGRTRSVRGLPLRKGGRSAGRGNGAVGADEMAFDSHWTMVGGAIEQQQHEPHVLVEGTLAESTTVPAGAERGRGPGTRIHKRLKAEEAIPDGPVDFV